ncbi:MAG: hypothetical protein ACXVJW_03690 [Acidimicrobiia bacterium]
MKPRTQPADIVDAYVQWAISSIDAWATSATAMADKIDQGSYTAADCVAEIGAWTAHMAEAAYDLCETLRTGARESKVTSEPYFTTPPPRRIAGGRVLRLAGPLTALMHQTVIGAAAVKIVPATLQDFDTEFHLEVDPTNLPGDAYFGKVEVVVAGAVTETLAVMVQVP